MSLATGIIAYLLIWWLVIFAVLPMGVERDPDPETGHMPGAPKEHGMKKKIVVTTLISALIWVVIFSLIRMNVIDFYEIARQMSEQDS